MKVTKLFALLLVSGISACLFRSPSHLALAEGLRKQGQYDAAISEYRLYISERSKVKGLPKDQDPNFYELLIGDCFLGMGKPEDALAAYLKAKELGMQDDLVAGKLRALAQYYEDKSEYQVAIELLKKYRTLDPLLFDLDIDRNHKKLIQAADLDSQPGLY